jgi:threonylcarbamoyladenosine tRNA methylthiotransferase MtaB
MLHILSDKKRRVFYDQNINREDEVLFEEDIENGMMFGFTRNYVRVTAKYDPLLVNETKYVRMTSITPEGHVEIEDVHVEVLKH